MILEALVAYYHTLLQQNIPDVPRSGWSNTKVSYALSLSPAGELLALLPLKIEAQRGKKSAEVPQSLIVPFQYDKGVSITSNFLCDNAMYLLGLIGNGKADRTEKAFASTKALHLELLCSATGIVGTAVRLFFEQWDPTAGAAHPVLSPHLEELAAGNLVFRVNGVYAQEDVELARLWQAYYDRPGTDDVLMPCLVTGKTAPIARTHPIIRGIRSKLTTGLKLVGFNAYAYESYGKTQSYNAPVSKAAAFAYTTALNYLLSKPEHRVDVGNVTVVCWAETGEDDYVSLFSQALNPSPDMDDALLHHIIQHLSHGLPVEEGGFTLRPETNFYILGLSPNAARVSIRFFLKNNFAAYIKNVGAHYQRLEIVKPPNQRLYLPPWILMQEIVNDKAKDKSPPAALLSGVLRAILENSRYPEALLQGVLLRISAEQKVTRGQAAILKSCLLQNRCWSKNYPTIKEAATVELNETCTYPPYLLGRLFFVLEDIQQASAGGTLKSTIKDRFFAAAGTTPAPIFAQLFRLETSHMKKLHRDKAGLAVTLEKQKGALIAALNESIPKHLNLEDQCIFRIGYYHQQQKHFTKKEDPQNV